MVAGGGERGGVRSLLSIRFWTLPLAFSPLTLWVYRLFDFWLDIAFCSLTGAACPLSVVYCLLWFYSRYVNSWIIINTVTGDRLKLTAASWQLDVSLLIIYCHLTPFQWQIKWVLPIKLPREITPDQWPMAALCFWTMGCRLSKRPIAHSWLTIFMTK